ncbi:hypothetical protein FY034_18080 (plasmid) [Trichlorobacter lovleyi]|uniref:hypothetical protein n=1 Tax=Trichlorobacter lovleyi TaxID=313985 RepID=UPI002240A7A4|nr:hypothetical protein [Trichlorobacter lovleyi]QOX80910.1 hypothetical protein FY034_18080 [Trichlorobacter lovleyi]
MTNTTLTTTAAADQLHKLIENCSKEKLAELYSAAFTSTCSINEEGALSVSQEKFRVYAVWGSDDAGAAANMQYEDKPDWTVLENDPDCYEFNTDKERDAFIQGAEAAEGWLDWYSMEEEEYQACCEQRGC